MGWIEQLEKEEKLSRNVSLKDYLPLGVGGEALFLFEAKTIVDLVWAVSFARDHGAPYKVIGSGTNLVFSDNIFEGLVIVNRASTLSLDEKHSRAIVDSGVHVSRMILDLAAKGYGGVESFIAYRGTVGGAIAKNFCDRKECMSQHLVSSSVLISAEKILSCKPVWFQFGSGKSKVSRGGLSSPVILSVIFQLQRKKSEVVLEIIGKAKSHLEKLEPDERVTEIFQDPAGDKERAEYFLSLAGAKKLSVGHARVSRKNANFVECKKGASALDVRQLVEKMREVVSKKYNLDLAERIEYFGKWNE